MDMDRLSVLGVDVSDQVRGFRNETARRAAWACALLATEKTRLEDPRAVRALDENDGGPAPERTLAALSARVDELDVRAWDLQDPVDTGQADESAYQRAFCQAAALRFALDPDVTANAAEAVYEAHHAIQDLPALEAVLLKAASSAR